MTSEPTPPTPSSAQPAFARFSERMRELAAQVEEVATDLQQTQTEVNRHFDELRVVLEHVRNEITLQQARADWQTEMLALFGNVLRLCGTGPVMVGSQPLPDTIPEPSEPSGLTSDLELEGDQDDTQSELLLPAPSGTNLAPVELDPVRPSYEPSTPPVPELDPRVKELSAIRTDVAWIRDALKKNNAPQAVDIQAALDVVQKEIAQLTAALQPGIEPGFRALRLRETAQRLFSGTLLYQDKLMVAYARATSPGTVEFVGKVRARRDRLWKWITMHEPDYVQLDVRRGDSASKPPQNVPRDRSQSWFEPIHEETATEQEYTILEVVTPGYLQRLPNGHAYTMVRPATLKIAIRPH